MGKIPVDDNHNEVLRKTVQDSTDGTKYDLRSMIVNDQVATRAIDAQSERLYSQLNLISLTLLEIKEILKGIGSE